MTHKYLEQTQEVLKMGKKKSLYTLNLYELGNRIKSQRGMLITIVAMEIYLSNL